VVRGGIESGQKDRLGFRAKNPSSIRNRYKGDPGKFASSKNFLLVRIIRIKIRNFVGRKSKNLAKNFEELFQEL
jgi:hypothetical protein